VPAPEQQQPRKAQPVQYYDYEEEITTTQRPLPAVPSRPKFSAPFQIFAASPAPPQPARTQFANAIPNDIIYADAPRPAKPTATFNQYQSLADRRPPQFPAEDERATPTLSPNVAANRADEYSLFSPAAETRGDIYKPKVRIYYPLSYAQRRRKRRKPKNVYIVVRKRRKIVYE
jgi:hypothetical protein